MLLKGGYPSLNERNVRQLIAVRDLGQFQTFVKMCAARTGQLLNLASLGEDCGISAVTAKQWLNALETSYIVSLLRPHHRNFGKRLVKTPKLYFLDSGLAAWLLGTRDAQILETHAALGSLFETWVVSELYKQRINAGLPTDLCFWRDSSGNEVDLIAQTAQGMIPIEIKSGSIFASDWAHILTKWQQLARNESLQPQTDLRWFAKLLARGDRCGRLARRGARADLKR